MHIDKNFIKEIMHTAKANMHSSKYEDKKHLYCDNFEEEFARLILVRCLDQLDTRKFYSSHFVDENTAIHRAKCDLIRLFGIDPI
jgi:hypothetical protein